MKQGKLVTILAAAALAGVSFTSSAQSDWSKIKNEYSSSGSWPTNEKFTLYNGGFEKTNVQIVVGYVNKSWRCTYEAGGQTITEREDFFGDPSDKFIHGIQFGALYTPSFDWGLGLRTGLLLEAYVSRSRWITSFCNNFTEGDMYIPLHASYRIPFDDEICLNFYGGIGFQWAMQGRYRRFVGTVWPGGWWWRRPIPIVQQYKHEYGNGWPKQVNWQAEVGANFHFKHFGLGFTYSFGLVDHGIQNTFDDGKSYITATRSRQDKMQTSLLFDF